MSKNISARSVINRKLMYRMKALILAAGQGTRLRSAIGGFPKCMVPVGHYPILNLWYQHLHDLGIRDVRVVIRPTDRIVSEHVAHLNGKHMQNWQTFIETVPLGTGGALAAHREWLSEACHYCVINADTLITGGIEQTVQLHHAGRSDLTMAVFRTPAPTSAGIVELNADGHVLSFTEKPHTSKSNLANAGFIILRKDANLPLAGQRPTFDLAKDVLQHFKGAMAVFELQGEVIDIGTPSALFRANQNLSGDADWLREPFRIACLDPQFQRIARAINERVGGSNALLRSR